MIEIRNLNIFLKKDLHMIIDNFSLSVNSGDKIAVIGKEGNGKSTFIKALYNPDLIDDYAEISGNVIIKNEVISYFGQDTEPRFLGKSTSELLYETVSLHEFDYNLYYKLLLKLSLDEEVISEDRLFENLSGGEKIKFKLLLCMMKEPTVLILDEPSNDLDIESLRMLETFINDLDITVIFISHDENLLKKCATKVIHLEVLPNKKAVHHISSLSYEDYIELRENKLRKQEKLYNKEHEEFNKQMERYQRMYDKVSSQLRKQKDPTRNLKDKMRSVKSMGKRFAREEKELTEKPMTENDVEFRFASDVGLHSKKVIVDINIPLLKINDRVLSRDIKLKVSATEKVCIIGSNGVGKSTLIKKVNKSLEDSKVRYFYMPQNYNDVFEENQNAIDFLTVDFTKEEHTRIRTYLGVINFSKEEMFRPVLDLSGGQKCELIFAKIILGKYDFLVLDEPSRNISPISSFSLRDALRNYSGGILAISHDRELINSVFDKVYNMTIDGLNTVDASEI